MVENLNSFIFAASSGDIERMKVSWQRFSHIRLSLFSLAFSLPLSIPSGVHLSRIVSHEYTLILYQTHSLMFHFFTLLLLLFHLFSISHFQRLIGRGVNPNAGDYDGRTAMHLSASNGLLETVQYLIDKGCDFAAKDRYGNTPLDDAVRHDHKEVRAILQLRLYILNLCSIQYYLYSVCSFSFCLSV